MLALALALSGSVVPQDPLPGVDRALARERAAVVRDVEYDLRFRLEAGAKDVRGSVWLRFVLPDDRDLQAPLVLDFGGDELAELRVNGRSTVPSAVHDHVLLPPDLLVRGRNSVHANFRSKVGATGTPLSVYRDSADGREYYYTLVVPADAHRLYPCFDQPDLRARFRVELDLPSDWTAVANTPRVETRAEGGPAAIGTLWQFAPSQPLPTYLMAFACGPFTVVDGGNPQLPGLDGTQPMRVFVRESQVPYLDRERLVTMHTEGLRWLAAQFGVPYPFGKLDLVLLPGFPYGGMEHAGAIFYRETALLFDHPATDAELVRRSTLVYHELSHQWFGNLVTMRWFDDLWLKEGFATFLGFQALEALEPERKSWLRFLQRVKPRAYEVDGTPGTTPVFQELQNLADAKSAYGAIVYNKAPAVLRELHARLGAKVFQQGLQRFLEQHAFGNADWQDLAAALEGAARADLGRWSERWLLAPSMPQVRVEWTRDADGLVTAASVVQRAVGGDGTWPLDLELLVFDLAGGRQTLHVGGDAERIEIADLVGKAAPAAILANPHDVAYGQFLPDAQSRAWLLSHLPDEPDPLVRAVGTQALSEAVREAELDPAAFATTLLSLLARETDADTHGWLLDLLATTLQRYLSPERGQPLRDRATELLLQQLGLEQDPARQMPIFRYLARNSGGAPVDAMCRAMVAAPIGKQDRFLAAAALLAAGKDDGEIERLQQTFAKEDVGKELFLARAATPTAAAKAEYWQLYLQLDTPPEQWTQDSLSWFHWRGQEELTLPYLGKALAQVDWVKQNRRIFFMPAWLDAFVNGHSSPAALAIVDEFLATTELSDDVRKKVLQSRDGLARAVRVRAAFATAPK
ncbi:MAG: ERAP1-like C-terminal domain-containing protein [Planctomycetes bacterium]|nr:ERAP1-like C-terminal domain-containing protein [Planctomycetota bacterium]